MLSVVLCLVVCLVAPSLSCEPASSQIPNVPSITAATTRFELGLVDRAPVGRVEVSVDASLAFDTIQTELFLKGLSVSVSATVALVDSGSALRVSLDAPTPSLTSPLVVSAARPLVNPIALFCSALMMAFTAAESSPVCGGDAFVLRVTAPRQLCVASAAALSTLNVRIVGVAVCGESATPTTPVLPEPTATSTAAIMSVAATPPPPPATSPSTTASAQQPPPTTAAATVPPIAYRRRTHLQVKSIQPDQLDATQIVGNAAGGVAMNLLWAHHDVNQASPCAGNLVEFEGQCFDVAASAARVRQFSSAGLFVTAVVYGTPSWAQIDAASCGTPVSPIFCVPRPEHLPRWAKFNRFLAWYFRGEIQDFVIQNEVNSKDWFSCGNCDVDTWVATYANVFNVAFDGIRAFQPNAHVLVSLDHHFDTRFDGMPRIMSGLTLLTKLDTLVGSRDVRIAMHSYPTDLRNPVFATTDFAATGKISFGSLAAMTGVLAKAWPNKPWMWQQIHLTENGINSLTPSGADAQSAQNTALCAAFRNVLNTPGIVDFVYHRGQDHPDEGGLKLGLWDTSGQPKPAWTTWALANRPPLSCGFEQGGLVRLKRYVSSTGVHSASSVPLDGLTIESQQWMLAREAEAGFVPLFACAKAVGNVVSTTATCENLAPLGVLGHAASSPTGSFSQPIYRCYAAGSGDHIISMSSTCESAAYKLEALLGYGVAAPN
jgi:hypothetical protein